MDVSLFISKRLRFRNSIAMIAIAISYLVMIIAVAVSSGFRSEIRDELSGISGDILLTPPNMNILDQSHPIIADEGYLSHISRIDAVERVIPVVCQAGIVKHGENIHGVMFKGVPQGDNRRNCPDTLALEVSVPSRLADMTGIKAGDRLTSYFVGEKMKVRQFNVTDIYESLVEADDKLVIYAGIDDLQRLTEWNSNQVSAIEIILGKDNKSEQTIFNTTQQVGAIVSAYSEQSDSPIIATSSVSRYSQLFDWLGLIDFNVLFVLILMTIVAGFNMISSLLILLFENISTIGLLKALGMSDRAIAKAFLARSAMVVLKGMAIGNILAMLFCFIQERTHLLKLDPSNYFVSFVPVNMNLPLVIAADAVSFVVIMLLLLIPTLFISKVDPARTVRMM